MIRPIDTQILYPQSPELSNRQQVDNQKPALQQDAFAQAMKNEVEQKKAIVNETHKDENVENKLQSRNKNKHQQDKKNKKNRKDAKQAKRVAKQSSIDIRI